MTPGAREPAARLPFRFQGAESDPPLTGQPFREILASRVLLRGLSLIARVLARPVDTAEESAEVACDGYDRNRHHFDRQAVSGQNSALRSFCSLVDPPNGADQEAGDASEDQVQQKHAFQALPFQLPLPGQQPSNDRRDGGNGSDKKIAIGSGGQALPLRPLRQQIKQNACDEQGDGKMNEHDVLSVLRENCCFEVERVHGCLSLTAR